MTSIYIQHIVCRNLGDGIVHLVVLSFLDTLSVGFGV